MALTPEQIKAGLTSLTSSDVKKSVPKKVKPLIEPSTTTTTTEIMPQVTSVQPLAPKQNIMSPSLEVQAGVQAPTNYKSIANDKEKTAFKRMLDDGLDPKLASETLKFAIDRRLEQENTARGQEPKKYVMTPEMFQEEQNKGLKDIAGGLISSATSVGESVTSLLDKPAQAIARAIAPSQGVSQEQVTSNIQSVQEREKTPIGARITGGDAESLGYKGGKLVGDIAQTAIVGGLASKIPAVAGAVSKLGAMGNAGKIAVGALEGAGGQAVYSGIADKRLPTAGELALGAGIGGAIPALPIVGKFTKDKILQPIQRTFGKKAEELAVKGLVNVNDAKNIVKTLKETGEGDVGSLGRRALSRNIAGKNTDNVISKLDDIKAQNYGGVRKSVNEVSEKVGAMGVDDTVANAMTTVSKNAESINARMGYNAVDNTEIIAIQKAAQDGTITLAQKQRAKELIDEFVNIYKKSGDVSDTLIASQADKLRNTIKNGIEDAVDTVTNGKVNIREMNREVAVAQAFKKAIETKAVANELKQYVIQGSLGGFTSNQGDFSTPEGWAKFLVGAFVGRQAGKMLGSPVVMGRIAKAIDKLSGSTRQGLLQYMKNPKVVKLTENQLGELLNVKNALSSISKDAGDNIPMRNSTVPSGNSSFPIVPVKKATPITPTGVVQETAPLSPVPTVAPKKTITETGRATHSPYAPKVEPVKTPVPVAPKPNNTLVDLQRSTLHTEVTKPLSKAEARTGNFETQYGKIEDIVFDRANPKYVINGKNYSPTEVKVFEKKQTADLDNILTEKVPVKTADESYILEIAKQGGQKASMLKQVSDDMVDPAKLSQTELAEYNKLLVTSIQKRGTEGADALEAMYNKFGKDVYGKKTPVPTTNTTTPKKQSVSPKPQEKQAVLEGKKYNTFDEYYNSLSDADLVKLKGNANRGILERGKIRKIREEKNPKTVAPKKETIQIPKKVTMDDTDTLTNLNPTGGIMVKYNPEKIDNMKLADNITTLDKTMKVNPDKEITIYRGTDFPQKDIVPGDFITTNYELAKSYSGKGNVITKKVKASDILDDINEPLGDEYIYKPKKDVIPKAKELQPLYEEAKKFKSAEDMISSMEKDGKVLYHGTPNKFDEFSLRYVGSTDEGFLGAGIYLTPRKGIAKQYGKNLMKAYPDIKNPLIIDDVYMFGGVNPDVIRQKLGLGLRSSASEVRKELIKQGYDGVYINELLGGGKKKLIEVVAVRPEQVKTESQLRKIREEANAN